MIQFVGLHLGIDGVRAASLGRDLRLWASSSTQLVNAREDESTGVTEIPAAEWVRSGCFCLQDVYLKLPVPARKVWGVGLSAPLGWIALDTSFEPLGPVRLTTETPVLDDIECWLEAEPRAAKRIQIILSAKDYFRFAISGGLATDVTTAGNLGLLADGTTQWSEALLAASPLQPTWCPPIFDSAEPTGRLSAEGVTQTRLPPGLWLVAGACETEASLLAGGDLRTATLWAHPAAGAGIRLAYGLPHLDAVDPPGGWQRRRSALAGQQLFTRCVEVATSDARYLGEYERELEDAGLTVTASCSVKGSPELGAALLACIGSKLVRRWEPFYEFKKREDS